MNTDGPGGVLELLHGGQLAASLGAALELRLFGLIAERPMRADEISRRLDIPPGRCRRWLETLGAAGLVECSRAGYTPGPLARTAILDSFTEDTWAFLALEAREAMARLVDLPDRLRARSESVARVPTYVKRMNADPDRARRFTRMLAELHAPLAAGIAGRLPLDDVSCLLDLGGGSGVVSMALARRHPEMSISVVDIPNVCAAGREIVADHGLADRIAFIPCDLAADDLPLGFDAAIECDVGFYDVAFFERVRAGLRPGGRFFIVDDLAADDAAPTAHPDWALARALDDPGFVPATVASVLAMLKSAGFGQVTHTALGGPDGIPDRAADAFASTMAVLVADA